MKNMCGGSWTLSGDQGQRIVVEAQVPARGEEVENEESGHQESEATHQGTGE
jgi:hypothetical protein